jgi:hypothetical protein
MGLTKKIGRNDPCHCGSGKKYKKCHERLDEACRRDSNEIWQCQINGRKVLATKADMDDYASERNLAMHESAHAVAHWIMGHTIEYVQLNDDITDKTAHADELAGVTVGGGAINEIMDLPDGERLVQARQQAFVTLAGVFGTNDAASENPLSESEVTDHLFQAGNKLMYFTGMSWEEATNEVVRLIPVVTECFDDKAVWNLVNILATFLQKSRRLEGEEVMSIIGQAYPLCKTAAAEGKVVLWKVEDTVEGAAANAD